MDTRFVTSVPKNNEFRTTLPNGKKVITQKTYGGYWRSFCDDHYLDEKESWVAKTHTEGLLQHVKAVVKAKKLFP